MMFTQAKGQHGENVQFPYKIQWGRVLLISTVFNKLIRFWFIAHCGLKEKKTHAVLNLSNLLFLIPSDWINTELK